jgi:hypothetical protein
MSRRKYQFRDRAEAEERYRETDRRRLAAEWFASGILLGRLTHTGRDETPTRHTQVGYFTTRCSAFVFAYYDDLGRDSGSPHCILGIWELDDLQDAIDAHDAHADTRPIAKLLAAAADAAELALCE